MAEGRRATGAHLLQHQAPAIAQTTEQTIRVAVDRVADWIFVVRGCDADALQGLAEADLAADRVVRHGAVPEQVGGLYTLSYSATSVDVM